MGSEDYRGSKDNAIVRDMVNELLALMHARRITYGEAFGIVDAMREMLTLGLIEEKGYIPVPDLTNVRTVDFQPTASKITVL